MLLLNKPKWHISENQATDENFFINRRQLGAGLAAGALFAPYHAQADNKPLVDATKQFYPGKPSAIYTKAQTKAELTKESDFGSYNNFYEFGSHKSISAAAQKLKSHPWTLEIEVEGQKAKTFAIEDIIKKIGLETRTYRFRCVEAWAMTVPWVGFSMAKLLTMAEVPNNMKFVTMFTAEQKDVMPGLQESWYPWPYIENLEMAEAMHDLCFLAVGAYDKPLPNQNGAPLRLVVPWKYGFKNIKSIQKISINNNRKKSFWEVVQGSEYGFYANVNPKFPHPRWSQANEKVLGTGQSRPTLMYNGYEEFIAPIYKDKQQDRSLFF